MLRTMSDSSETDETGGKSATSRDKAYTSRKSRSSRLSRAPSLTLPHNMGEGWVGDRRTVMNNAG